MILRNYELTSLIFQFDSGFCFEYKIFITKQNRIWVDRDLRFAAKKTKKDLGNINSADIALNYIQCISLWLVGCGHPVKLQMEIIKMWSIFPPLSAY